MGLLDNNGKELPLNWQCGSEQGSAPVLPVREAEQTFVFHGLNERPLPSLLRDFSAPVKLEYGYSDEQLAFLLQHDSNLFNRWDASQTLGSRVLLQMAADFRASKPLTLPVVLTQALQAVLRDDAVDNAVRARLLQLPDIAYLQEQVEVVDIDALVAAQRYLRRTLAEALHDDLLASQQRHRGASGIDGVASGKRALANTCLAMLVDSGRESAYVLAAQQAGDAGNMTDRFAAVKALAHSDAPQRAAVLTDFAERFKDDALVMDKWFAVQASAPIASVLDDIRRLEQHPAFDVRNPNKVRALWLAFSHSNPSEFHRADGSGYAFIAERVARLNDSNPQVAARLVSCFNRWKKFDDARQQLMLAQLKLLLGKSGLSAYVFEIVSKSVSA
jgi:aminopeptidase N